MSGATDLAGQVVDVSTLSNVQLFATWLFAIAVIHTLLAGRIAGYAHHYPRNSIPHNLLHFLGEVEVVFGLWAGLFVTWLSFKFSTETAIYYLSTVNYTEALFVFVIMAMTATRPVVEGAALVIDRVAKLIPLPGSMAFYVACIFVGSLMGSFITEPAAMTVCALLLRDRFFTADRSDLFRYLTIGLLFVAVSIGGTLTHFAAPPVLMVAGPWGWDMGFMFTHFGWKAATAIALGLGIACLVLKMEFAKPMSQVHGGAGEKGKTPIWLILSHIAFVGLVVAYHAYVVFFIPVFLLFLGWVEVTKKHQELVQLRGSLLVAFFLGGLVTLGKLQGWWLQPLLSSLSENALFFSAVGLTAVTDNAALTYLGTLVPDLSDRMKYLLVAGAVTGGGLTVIANAPNPAGFRILGERFGSRGIEPLKLFLGALPFTIIAALCFLLF